jgi:hypothetical protein
MASGRRKSSKTFFCLTHKIFLITSSQLASNLSALSVYACFGIMNLCELPAQNQKFHFNHAKLFHYLDWMRAATAATTH